MPPRNRDGICFCAIFQTADPEDLVPCSRPSSTRPAAATPTAVVVAAGTAWAACTASRSACSRGLHWSSIHGVEVRLILLVELLHVSFVEVISAFDQDRALIGSGLTLVKFVARRPWSILDRPG